ncbi:uncharacterized protein HMPREF1541_07214 [Cyphellophora europaea CBS 101466]|uniref:Uncharacterized protein n=1 Tax=Cyphellophora europaea (strain CBS 101466) TaxID=1220924 RepID=W2RM83_CYPE1|nr:uncharacterized protein HMPREF1541_07214 [Cyphellophora europaea CBS 101466]ETN37592.1 hypothetical protein HMPREF1541_07214 [Cyphellophora europaea CBS 101466]
MSSIPPILPRTTRESARLEREALARTTRRSPSADDANNQDAAGIPADEPQKEPREPFLRALKKVVKVSETLGGHFEELSKTYIEKSDEYRQTRENLDAANDSIDQLRRDLDIANEYTEQLRQDLDIANDNLDLASDYIEQLEHNDSRLAPSSSSQGSAARGEAIVRRAEKTTLASTVSSLLPRDVQRIPLCPPVPAPVPVPPSVGLSTAEAYLIDHQDQSSPDENPFSYFDNINIVVTDDKSTGIKKVIASALIATDNSSLANCEVIFLIWRDGKVTEGWYRANADMLHEYIVDQKELVVRGVRPAVPATEDAEDLWVKVVFFAKGQSSKAIRAYEKFELLRDRGGSPRVGALLIRRYGESCCCVLVPF